MQHIEHPKDFFILSGSPSSSIYTLYPIIPLHLISQVITTSQPTIQKLFSVLDIIS